MNLVRVAPVHIHDENRIVNIRRSPNLRRHRRRYTGDSDLLAVPRERMIVGGHHLLAHIYLLRFSAVGAAHWYTIQAAAHVGDDVHSVGSPVGSMPLSRDGEDGRCRGLLLYVIDYKMGAVFRGNSARLRWILRGKPRGSENQPQRQHKNPAW